MGASGSKKLQVVQPIRKNWSSHRRPNKHQRNQTILVHDNTEWSVLHKGTLERYKVNYPEQADGLQTVFDKMQLLRHIFASNSRGLNQNTMQGVIENLVSLVSTTYSRHISDGTTQVRRNTTIVDFLMEIEGPETLQKFAQKFFNDYFEMAGEQPEESEPGSSHSICFRCLNQVLLTILSITDFHKGFCSASAKAGVVSMCLEKIVRLDKENDNWQNEDEESEPLQLLDACLGILHNISLWLRDRE